VLNQFGDEVAGAASKPTAQRRLIGLLEYIEHVEKMNRTPPFDVPTNYYCGYEQELRALPNLEFNQASDEVWLSVPRLKEREPPDPSSALKPWLVLNKSPDVEPTLREHSTLHASVKGETSKTVGRADFPQVDVLFRHYLNGPWATWAEAERPRRITIGTYNKLFLLHQALEAEGTDTPLELVWGLGVAIWKHPTGRLVRYPLITQLVEIGLDAETLALEVRPRDRLPTLETDAYAALEVSGVVQLEATWEGYLENTELAFSPFDSASAAGLLKLAAGCLDGSGLYWPDMQTQPTSRALPAPTNNLIVTDTWVLFARKRSPNFLIDDLQRLRKNIEQLATVPEGPAALVTELPDEVVESPRIYFRGRSFSGRKAMTGEPVRELYFPKPYNDEQVSIVEKLERCAGVVVQGPPGTGKTHTIANVICHYLAKGKRVLVTSKGEPALAVLREQIPEAIQALTVALLTDERDGMRQFEHAIQTIAAKVSRIQPDDLDRQIQGLERQLEELHSRLAATDHDIASWARKHLEKIEFDHRTVMPVELAKMVVEKEAECGWIPDRLSGFEAPSFTEHDVQAIRTARRHLGQDIAYLQCELPASTSLFEPTRLGEIHEALLQSSSLERKLTRANAMRFISSDPSVVQQAEKLNAELSDAINTYDQVYRLNIAGTESLHRSFQQTATGRLQGLETILREAIEMEGIRQKFILKPVGIPKDLDAGADFREAVERLAAGKSALGLLGFTKRALKAELDKVTVSGLPPNSTEGWEHVVAHRNFQDKATGFVARWNAAAAEVHLPQVASNDPSSFRKVYELTEHVRRVRKLAIEHRNCIASLSGVVFGPHGARNDVTIARKLMEELQQVIDDQLTRFRLAEANSASEGLKSALRRLAQSGVVKQLRAVLENDLGQADVDKEYVVKKWSSLLAELRRLESLGNALNEVIRVSERIEKSGAIQWAEKLRKDPVNGVVDVWTPASWLEAWQWRQAATFIDEIDGRKALRALQSQRESTETDLAQTYQALVESKTWLEVYRNSPPAVKAALQAYLNAVRLIGKGTGIRAIRHRKAARAAMLDAYRAVPCWILPQWRVSETLPPEIGKFDLVIVDEASQSDLWVLPALLRGIKVMVVGDDKQVSPEGVGLAEERIKDLKNRFLGEQAHGDQMTPEKSMYDLAKVVFAGEMVMLREHFRSVPPIIEFSKREFYNHEIQPLRIPKGSERLDPPLIDVFVRGGARDGKVNDAEARAIVNEIKAIISDPLCKGKSIGVVSLLGIEQAHHIFELIREFIPAEEIVSRKMTVGDAGTFQGKERDIMLLSMVSTPRNTMAATARMYEQRFNVAASRARDRMYLFRSVELADLPKTDLKAKLIEHFRAPFHQDPRRVSSLRELCQSDFERDMFDELTKAGFRVTPQVPVGGYFIDMVIEGTEDRRLAVECDGDKYHGPEQWGHDTARQRILERAGWTFWRCFGSNFNRDRKGVLGELFDTLTAMGITPLGSAEVDLGAYTEHRTVDATGASGAGEDGANAAEPQPKTTLGKSSSYTAPIEKAVMSVAEPAFEVAPPPRAPAPVQSEGSAYSDQAVFSFADHHGMQNEDFRKKGGALWLQGNDSPEIARQLKTWGFQFAAKRGWWKK
jgi:very-short-patch-repair endonuclease